MPDNQFGQPVGNNLLNWQPRQPPQNMVLQGRTCRIEPLNVPKHLNDLYEAYSQAPDGRDWTYMFAGPFTNKETFADYLTSAAASLDPKHYAIVELASEQALGTFSLMRIDVHHGVIEVGNVAFSPRLKQTTMATEAHFLLMQYVFEQLHYRRYEWKCDSLNAPSRRAALRLGFTFEGIFRQAIVYKGRTRDTAWFSVIDKEWSAMKTAFNSWLSPHNFDAQGHQIKPLEEIRKSQ
ncbi:GNAT family N-acetyltransferase [Vibrio sp. CAIM 722]|uniref:GNAT family N-acetyltransferase n=1 Tax=Vibrio eleionomae TaxID=2653505 RepID=A0A7X4RTZ0_9VIBR|nr:GNAT family protein [Vibrio eleionomae]MZI92933.1 GNAT family N-acetyltransferase [Vibrio eleionomae]